MHAMPHHMDDEHMQFYEWSGAGTGMPHALPAGSKRNHPWHASYAVLALLTSLLILNGCDSKGPAEKAGEQVDQAMQEMKEEAGSVNEAREQTGEKIEQLGEDLQKP